MPCGTTDENAMSMCRGNHWRDHFERKDGGAFKQYDTERFLTDVSKIDEKTGKRVADKVAYDKQ